MPQAFVGQQGRRRAIPVAALVLGALVTAALGVWQVKRLAWKEALIAHVEAVSHAAPVDAATLPFTPTAEALTYRAVTLSGHFEPRAIVLATALTDLGGGYWEMVPLRLADRRAVWVNRGFVPLGSRRDRLPIPENEVSLTGLLRRSEPGGGFLRPNRPASDGWYSRDIAAMSLANGVPQAAAWFVDARGTAASGQPVPGLTVLTFPNNHLQYALTWFALSAMSLLGIALVLRTRQN